MSNKGDSTEKKVIIIAEDDYTSYVLLEVFLSGYNYQLVNTLDGKQTIEALKKYPNAALILMDLKMPVMDGYIATREIRKFNKNIPIIAQTAYALSGDSKKAMDAGCNDYVTKPVKKEDFLMKVDKWLNKQL
jgi:two-component system, cell cycle response regulator DivK